jgi:Flp pilus assembly protein TadG
VVAVIRRADPRDAGQSLVEFAILLPILLAVVIGIFEFGRAWNVDQVLTSAAREGVRLAVVEATTSESQVIAAMEEALTNAALDPSLANITVEGMDAGYGNPATVEISYPYEFTFLGPLVAFLGDGGGEIPGAITLSSRIAMRNE